MAEAVVNVKTNGSVDKPSTPWLGMAKLDTYKMTLFETEMIVPKMMWRFCCISFICGYSDAHTLLARGVFSTMMTGNFVILMVAAKSKQNLVVEKVIITIISYVVGGAAMNIHILSYFKNWEAAFSITVLNYIIGTIVCEVCDLSFGPSTYNLTLYLYVGAIGNMCYWTTKSGLMVFLQTGNMLKTMEFAMKYFAGYSVGDAKAIGDSFVLILLQLFFAVGALLAAVVNNYIPNGVRLVPLIFLSVCLIVDDNWAYISKCWKPEEPLLPENSGTSSFPS